jgi:hypothetical protein
MYNWEIVFWIAAVTIFNPIFTYLLFVRRAKVNKKGKIIIYSTTTMIALFWCGVSTGYFMLSIISGLYFTALIIFKNSFFANIRQGG